MPTMKLLNVSRESGTIEVLYNDQFRVAVPIPLDKNNQIPTGETLLFHLLLYYPQEQVTRHQRIMSANVDHISALKDMPMEVGAKLQQLTAARQDGSIYTLLNVTPPTTGQVDNVGAMFGNITAIPDGVQNGDLVEEEV